MANNRLQTLKLLTLALALFCTVGDTADASSGVWTVSIKTSVVDHCLEYPESKLQPLIRSSVHFEEEFLEPTAEDKELEKKGGQPDVAIPPTLYENQYSSHLRTVGMHRFKQLMLKPGTPGEIKVSTSNSSLKQEEVNAAANTTMRLLLDLYLNKMPLRSVAVSRDIFDNYVQELQRYGFRTATIVPGQTIKGVMPLQVRSDPAGRAVFLMYGM